MAPLDEAIGLPGLWAFAGTLHAPAAFRQAVWCLYLLAAVILPMYHVRPILKYRRGTGGIGDACIRTETIQCLWRLPALMFSVFVAPSLPLFLSIFLDMLGRIGRVLAMRGSQRRWVMAQLHDAESRLAVLGAARANALNKRAALDGLPSDAHATCPGGDNVSWVEMKYFRPRRHLRLLPVDFSSTHAIAQTDEFSTSRLLHPGGLPWLGHR